MPPTGPPGETGSANWSTDADIVRAFGAAIDPGGMSADLTVKVKRIFRTTEREVDPPAASPERIENPTIDPRRLTLVPRVDMRGIDHRSRRVDRRPRERRQQRHAARSTSSADSPDGDLDSDDADPWPGGCTFRACDALVSTALPGHIRLRLFDALPERWQREAWDALGREMERKGAAR